MATLPTIEEELRKRALWQFTNSIDSSLDALRASIAVNAGTLFNRIPMDITTDIDGLRDRLVSRLGQKVQDEAVRRGAEVIAKAMGGV